MEILKRVEYLIDKLGTFAKKYFVQIFLDKLFYMI